MTIDPITILGLVAASFTTVAFLPQVLKIWRTKSAGDLSLSTFGTFCFGVVLWLTYGLLIGDLPIILSNIVTLALSGAVLALALRYRAGEDRGRSGNGRVRPE